MNPYDWTGPSFLGLFGLVSVNAALAAHGYRQTQIGKIKRDLSKPIPQLDSYELAYLSGGGETAVLAAVANLVQSKAVEVSPVFGTHSLQAKAKGLAEPHHLVTEVLHALSSLSTDSVRTAVNKIKSRPLASLTQIRNKLEENTLICSLRRSAEIASTSAIIMATPAVLSIPKLFIGLKFVWLVIQSGSEGVAISKIWSRKRADREPASTQLST
jgi:uncharacterized protein (TIGR04222 family)